MVKLMIEAMYIYLYMCQSIIETVVDDNFLLSKPKSQEMAYGQRLTLAMMAGRLLFQRGGGMNMDCEVSHGSGWTKMVLDMAKLLAFGFGREVKSGWRRARAKEMVAVRAEW